MPPSSAKSPARPPADNFIAARLKNLRASMARQKLPAVLVTNFADVSYLTGFEGDDSYALVTPDSFLLISDSRYEEQITREAPWVNVFMRQKSIVPETAKLLRRLKVKTIGVQDESMTLAQRSGLVEALTKGKPKNKITLKPVHEIIIELRHLKDAREVALIERAIAIAEHGFEAVKEHLQPGMTENEIASQLVHEMRKRGASGPSFDCIVAAGANGSLPHYRPGEVRLERNSALLIDWGARAGGYLSDLTRTLFVGSVPPVIAEIYRVVLDAQLAAIAAIKPGKSGKEVDGVARKMIEKAGYGKNFGHGLGHGLGRDIHETLSLSRFSKTRLKPGMIVTVEPGIYLPGVGGVRIEDDVLVTESGCRVLSHLPKDLESQRV